MERDGVRPSEGYQDAANKDMEARYPDVQQVLIDSSISLI